MGTAATVICGVNNGSKPAMLVALLLGVVFITTILACLSDINTLRIPNLYSVVVIVAFAIGFIAAPESFGSWKEHLGAFAIILTVTYIMFMVGMMGGGDSKFGSALALWVGAHGLLFFIFWMGLMGGIIGGISLYFKKKKPVQNPKEGSWIAQVQAGRNAVPYGIAISFGAWAALWQTGFIIQQLDELSKIIH